MLAINPISQDVISKHLQVQAQSDLEQARRYKPQSVELALAFYNRAKVTFRDMASARQLLPLSELKDAFNQAHTPQTAEDESLRQRIAEVYFERAEVLKSLGKLDKAQKSYEKAQAWGYKAIPIAATADLISSAEFFASKVFLTPSPKEPQACPPTKHQWVAQIFETTLKQFQDLDLCQSSPSLFLVYAHNNNRLGKADAEASQRVIQWLSNLRYNLYSDRSASGHQALPFAATQEESAKANDILSSQLCLLPNHAGSVDYVVLCGSELLGHYMASPYYQGFCEAIQRAYKETSEHTNDFTQIEAAIRKVVDANLNEKEFHHVLTELVFLQIRYEHHQDKHGIIPLLLNSTAAQCLPKFIIDSTAIRIEDSIWRTPNMWNGKQTYQDEGLHIGFFKLLKRLLVKQEQCISLVEDKVYQACLQKLREDLSHTLTAEAFFMFLNQSCVTALEALKRDGASDLRELNIQKAYENILSEIKQINDESSVAPDQIRLALETSYSAKRLAIQRLSGPPLSMEDCYINLAIVEHKQISQEEKSISADAAPNYFHRLPSVEAINSNPQKLVPLEKLFDPRALSNGNTMTPKRIFIRGRAGVGKTTLSKKIVYEYMQKGQWRNYFDYLLWIPLRRLKGKQNCDLATLFYEIYFYHHPKGQALAKTLEAQINGVAKKKTLFVLDGWDEVAQEWGEHEPMFEFMEELLNQPAVLITSRPYVDLKQAQPMDLELETVGFNPQNVTDYLDNPSIVSSSEAEEIKHFTNANPFIQELVNVPIQLDALCYSWDEIKRSQQEISGPVTVTALYQAMINKLWRKDILSLGKREGGELLTAEKVNALRSASRIEKWIKAEHDCLSALAFKGLQENRIEFAPPYLDSLIAQLEAEGVDLPITLEENLKKLSFLHTDDVEQEQRSYHFMHLTFQEFFAAKHFVQCWETGQEIALLSVDANRWAKVPVEAFVHQHKYNPRYEIMWWFVSGLLRGQVLNRFFDVLEAEPYDLFGASHQRLMTSYLHEASRLPDVGLSPDIRGRLTQHLEKWLQLEIDNRGSATLAYQPTFPEPLLFKCLKKVTPAKTKGAVADAFEHRSVLSDAAIQVLIALTKEKDEKGYVRGAAVKALGQSSSLSADALQALIMCTTDGNGYVRGAAVNALGQQSSLSTEAIKALIALAKDEGSSVRDAAIQVLSQPPSLSTDTIQALVALAKDEDTYVWDKKAAVRALGQQSSLSTEALQALIALAKDESMELKDESKEARNTAVRALGQQSSLSAEVIQTLIVLSKGESDGVRGAVADALGQQSLLSAEAFQILIVLAKDKSDGVRGAAVNVLGQQSSLSAEALQTLNVLANDKSDGVRGAVAGALGQQSSLSAEALQILIVLAKDKSDEVRGAASWALGRQFLLPAEVIHELLGLAKGDNKEVARAAIGVLGQQPLLSSESLQLLIALAEDEDEEVRQTVVNTLGQQFSLSTQATQILIERTKDGDWNVRSAAVYGLGRQSSLSAEAIQTLIVLAKDKREYMRGDAIRALGSQSLLSTETRQALIALAKDEDRGVRLAAVQILGYQSSLPAEAIQVLIARAKDEDWEVSDAAVKALSEQSSLPTEAMQILIARTKHRSHHVRVMAAQMLKKRHETLLHLLPTLNRQNMELVYKEYLLQTRFDQSVPFYLHDGALCFYTAQGLQTVPFSKPSKEATFKQIIQQAQQAAGIPVERSSTKRNWGSAKIRELMGKSTER